VLNFSLIIGILFSSFIEPSVHVLWNIMELSFNHLSDILSILFSLVLFARELLFSFGHVILHYLFIYCLTQC
jgi:hypothetical protein